VGITRTLFGQERKMNINKLIVDDNPFIKYPKTTRLYRECLITEKIDGSNAQVYIKDDGTILAGSRNKWIFPGRQDNFGFAQWVEDNKEQLLLLGPGRHFGEWYGQGIQRKYSMTERKFALFNVDKENPVCTTVPVLYRGNYNEHCVLDALDDLRSNGSRINPSTESEGLIIRLLMSGQAYKVMLYGDDKHKGELPCTS